MTIEETVEDIFVPALGHTMKECLLVEWIVQSGDPVRAGDDIAIIETDKSTMELTASSEGRLGRHLYAAGSRIAVGEIVAYVLADGEEEPPGHTPAVVSRPERRDDQAIAGDRQDDEQVASAGSPPARHRLSPRERRQAREAAMTSPSSPELTSEGDDDRARFRGAIADTVSQAWRSIPHFTVSRDIRADVLRAVVTERRASGVRITVTDVLLRALAIALEDSGQHVAPSIGLAVATDRGVAIPVIPAPAHRDLREVASLRAAAVERSRMRRACTDDTLVPAATLSNLGSLGVRRFTGVIPLGQSILLTTGAITPLIAAADGKIITYDVLDATLNLDHRHFDGAHGAELLARLADVLSSTDRLTHEPIQQQ